MKVRFVCDNGANIHSALKHTFDTEKDLGLEEGEWEQLSDEDKHAMVWEWAVQEIETYWEEA